MTPAHPPRPDLRLVVGETLAPEAVAILLRDLAAAAAPVPMPQGTRR